MPVTRRATTDAVEILHREFYKGDPEKLKSLAECRANDEIARKIQALRTKAGLTQAQLAKLVGTTASVICRLEDADYEGHSVAMLRRIAAALNRRVEIRFLPLPKSASLSTPFRKCGRVFCAPGATAPSRSRLGRQPRSEPRP